MSSKRTTYWSGAAISVTEKRGAVSHSTGVPGASCSTSSTLIASQKLRETTYAFAAFIALQLRRAAALSAPPAPTITIRCRNQGPSIPSTSAPTAAQTLLTDLNEHLLPHVNPFLAKLRAQTAERDRERKLRDEQGCAFAESTRKDAGRIERRVPRRRSTRRRKRGSVERHTGWLGVAIFDGQSSCVSLVRERTSVATPCVSACPWPKDAALCASLADTYRSSCKLLSLSPKTPPRRLTQIRYQVQHAPLSAPTIFTSVRMKPLSCISLRTPHF